MKAPVLIIGLGGTGMDALRITKKLIYDTIQSEKKDGEYTDKPKNIEYLGIDTDEGEEKKSYQGMYLNKTAGGDPDLYYAPCAAGAGPPGASAPLYQQLAEYQY